MTSVAATSAAAEEASEQLALRRKEREQGPGGLEEGGADITDAASMAVSPSAQLRNAGKAGDEAVARRGDAASRRTISSVASVTRVSSRRSAAPGRTMLSCEPSSRVRPLASQESRRRTLPSR